MISYEPLRKVLDERNMKMSHLRKDHGGFLSRGSVTKLKQDKNIEVSTIEKICLELDIPVEKVLKIVK